MPKNKQQPQPLLNIGTSLLLVLFLVLCLATFAALSLSSARSDYSFSEKLAARKTDYYAASNTAEEILAGLDPIMEENASSGEALTDAVTEFFEGNSYGDGIVYAVDTGAEQPTVTYEVPVNDSQSLHVTLAAADGSYEITEWQVENEGGTRETQTLKLLPITVE